MAVFRTDYIRKPFTAAGFEEAGWQKAFHRHPTERVRRKLRAVRAFALGQPIREQDLRIRGKTRSERQKAIQEGLPSGRNRHF